MRVQGEVSATENATKRFGYDSYYRLAEMDNTFDTLIYDPETLSPATMPIPDPIPNIQSRMDALIGPMSLGLKNRTFDYDIVGNRLLEETPDGGISQYIVNNLDQYASRGDVCFEYDANGNMISDGTRDFRYDSANRLVHVLDKATGDSIVRFFHDVHGRRILELCGAVATHLVYNGPDLIEEYRNGNLFAQYVNDTKKWIARSNREESLIILELGGPIIS